MAKIKFESLITTTERIELVGSGTSKYFKKGAKYLVHPIRAKRYIDNGWLVKPAEKKAK